VSTDYPPPVDKLLTYGEGQYASLRDWHKYLEEFGFGPEHIPDLLRMATDNELHWAYSDSTEVWAPIHAWRTLGQLRAEAAIEPLLPLFDSLEEREWAMEELPDVFGMIGPVAIPAVATYIADTSHSDWPRIHATACLEKIGTMHPESRDACIAALVRPLTLFEENDETFNAFLMHGLIELKATETAPLIKRAFAAKCVDLLVQGDWDDVQAALGLKSREEVSADRFNYLPAATVQSLPAGGSVFSQPSKSHRDHTGHKKTKSKMAKESRKKNRKQK
jgi:hypothetical protein